MSVFLAFYVSGGTFWGRNCLNKLFFSHFFFEQETFQISGEVLSARLPGKQSMWLETFSHEMYCLRELVVYIIIFKNWAEGFWNFVQFFGSVVKNAFLVCGGTFRGKIFFPKKVNFVFGFWSAKFWFWETTRHVRKNCPYVEKRTFGAAFFENVISRIIIFGSWAKYFLPSMERVWHGCEKDILRDQTTFKGAYYFKVQETKLFE